MDVSTLQKSELASMWPNMDLYEESSLFSFHEAQPALISFYAVLWVIGAVGNGWVAFMVGYLLITRRTSRRAGDAPLAVQIYIFSLCWCDLVVLAFLPLLLLDLVYGSWKIPSSCLCKLYLLSEGFNKFGAPWLLTALSGYCYSNIQRMAQFESKSGYDSEMDKDQMRKTSSCSTASSYYRSRVASESSKSLSNGSGNLIRRDSGRKSVITVLICAFGVVVAMSPVFFYADVHYVVVHNQTEVHILALKCAFQPPEHILTAFTVYSFLTGYLFPACLFTYYYSAILFYVRRHRANYVHTSGASGRSQKRYCRVAKTAIGLTVWTLAGWTPYWTIFLYFYFHPQSDVISAVNAPTTIVLSYFVHMLPYINCTGYPILYTLLNKNIRSAYARAKTASANRRKRQRLASGPEIGTVTSSSRSSGGRTAARTSYDGPSTCGALTPMTISLQYDDGSTSLALSDEFGHANRVQTPTGITDQKCLQV